MAEPGSSGVSRRAEGGGSEGSEPRSLRGPDLAHSSQGLAPIATHLPSHPPASSRSASTPLSTSPAVDDPFLLDWDSIDPPETPLRPSLSSWCLLNPEGCCQASLGALNATATIGSPPRPAAACGTGALSRTALDAAVALSRRQGGTGRAASPAASHVSSAAGRHVRRSMSDRGQEAQHAQHAAGLARSQSALGRAEHGQHPQHAKAGASSKAGRGAPRHPQQSTVADGTPEAPPAELADPAAHGEGAEGADAAVPAAIGEDWQAWPPPEVAWRAAQQAQHAQRAAGCDPHQLWCAVLGSYGYQPPDSTAPVKGPQGRELEYPQPEARMDQAWFGSGGGRGREQRRSTGLKQRVKGWCQELMEKLQDTCSDPVVVRQGSVGRNSS